MGRFYEEFEVGQRFETGRRTVIEPDIDAFAGLTADFNPVHMDEVFAAQNGFKGRITHGPMIVGMAFGLASRADVMDGTVLALLEIGWKFVKPVRPAIPSGRCSPCSTSGQAVRPTAASSRCRSRCSISTARSRRPAARRHLSGATRRSAEDSPRKRKAPPKRGVRSWRGDLLTAGSAPVWQAALSLAS